MKKFTNYRDKRRIEPMKPEETKYIKELLQRINDENISPITEGVYDPNMLTQSFLLGLNSGKSYVVRKTTGGLG